jgi:hypothetical protein
MLELVITVTMSVSSILLFCYWFGYACRLILSATTSQDYATNVAQAHRLSFQEAQLRLSRGPMELNGLKEMLDRDYAVLARLMNHAEDAHAGVERRMLAIHYSLAAACYRASSGISIAAARRALEEMSMVVAYFANSIGEASASAAAA